MAAAGGGGGGGGRENVEEQRGRSLDPLVMKASQ